MNKSLSAKLLALLLAMSGMVAFTSCSTDEEETNNVDSEIVARLNPVIKSYEDKHAWKDMLSDVLNLQFKVIVFEYTTVGPDLTTPIRLTGEIAMSLDCFNHKVEPGQIMLYNQFTCAKHGERLSQNEVDDYGIYTKKLDRIGISADLYGWSNTEDKPQAYCCTEITARETIDAYDAACYLLDSLGYNHKNLPMYNVGYSSGALSAIAVQRYVDANRPDIHFDITAAGGGPYDIAQVYKDYVEADTTGYICSLPLMCVAYKETFNLPYSYKDFFQEPLGSHVDDWILSKAYTTQEINDLIGREHHISEVLTPEACDTTSVLGQDLLTRFRQNSVCGPTQTWQPNTATKYFIYHSIGDLYIPYTIGVEMADYLKNKGCEVTTMFANHGNHVEYGLLVFMGLTSAMFESVSDK